MCFFNTCTCLTASIVLVVIKLLKGKYSCYSLFNCSLSFFDSVSSSSSPLLSSLPSLPLRRKLISGSCSWIQVHSTWIYLKPLKVLQVLQLIMYVYMYIFGKIISRPSISSTTLIWQTCHVHLSVSGQKIIITSFPQYKLQHDFDCFISRFYFFQTRFSARMSVLEIIYMYLVNCTFQ